jgi:hypothetical protein
LGKTKDKIAIDPNEQRKTCFVLGWMNLTDGWFTREKLLEFALILEKGFVPKEKFL